VALTLFWFEPGDHRPRARLLEGRIAIGSAVDERGIRIEHGTVLPAHAEIDATNEAVPVVRSSSPDGALFVNDLLREEAKLAVGDTLRVGLVLLRVGTRQKERPAAANPVPIPRSPGAPTARPAPAVEISLSPRAARFGAAAAAILVLALAVAAIRSGGGPSPRRATKGSAASPLAGVLPGVATLTVDFGGGMVSTGSGFVVDARGLLVTNAHVVGMSDDVRIKLKDGTALAGKVAFRNREVDLAVVRFSPPPNLTVLELGDSEGLVPGQEVYAVGTPISEQFSSSVTRGVVSAVRLVDGVQLVQHDAAINPGNSGGPLVDANGEVVGVNTLRIEQAGGRVAEGMSFAISAKEVRLFLREKKILE
jgi:S1-C subfamily serine protease